MDRITIRQKEGWMEGWTDERIDGTNKNYISFLHTMGYNK